MSVIVDRFTFLSTLTLEYPLLLFSRIISGYFTEQKKKVGKQIKKKGNLERRSVTPLRDLLKY